MRAAGAAVHAVGEQETTDLEKCLYSVEAPLFLGVGFLGGRVDHQLAAMNALVKYAGRAGGAGRRARTSAFSARRSSRSSSPPARGCRSFRWRPVRGRAVGGAALVGRGAGARARTGRSARRTGARRAGARRLRRAPGARDPAGGACSGRWSARLRGAEASARSRLVIVTATRVGHRHGDAGARAQDEAKLRKSGGTTARRVKPSGVRKVARPLLLS